MTETTWSWSLHEWIPSSLTIAHKYLELLLKALQEAGWDGRDFFHVQMASEEALVNSVTHGNQECPDKRVEVEMHVSPELVSIRFKDEGCGFHPELLPDPRCTDRICMEHGRGVLLMRKMMSEVRYLGCGNEVVMLRHRFDPNLAEDEDEDDDDVFCQD
jgi:serine/threonine-protein kinase RsbW